MTHSKIFSLRFLIVVTVVVAFFGFAFMVNAQTSSDIEFPVVQLGDCDSSEECFAYCEDSSHATECVTWANANGFDAGDTDVSDDEARAILEERGEGPGGCKNFEECNTFCSNSANEELCFNFGVEHGLIDKNAAEKIEKTRNIRNEGGPGGCRGREACDSFCREPENRLQCVNFAVEKGFMSVEEATQ